MATQEQLELRKKWIAALRSGEYKQTTGYLKLGDSYCCLGVLCDLVGVPALPSGYMSFSFDGEDSILPTHVANQIGLIDNFGSHKMINPNYDNYLLQIHLAKLNDNGKSFEEIADVIENNPTLWKE